MIDTAENPRAVVGGNQPPLTPYEAMSAHIGDLFETAQGFLDGDPVATKGQAEAVSKLIDDARKAQKEADAQRKLEAKPFDDGKAAVQALWTPLTDDKKGKCALIIATAKKALEPWLIAEEARLEAERVALRKAAEEAAAKVHQAHQASPSDLCAAGNAKVAEKVAEGLLRDANRADKQRAHATGGERAIGLRSHWVSAVEDYTVFARWAWAERPDDMHKFLDELAGKEVAAGKRALPGVTINEERRAA